MRESDWFAFGDKEFYPVPGTSQPGIIRYKGAT
jgi:hypothetical protein